MNGRPAVLLPQAEIKEEKQQKRPGSGAFVHKIFARTDRRLEVELTQCVRGEI